MIYIVSRYLRTAMEAARADHLERIEFKPITNPRQVEGLRFRGSDEVWWAWPTTELAMAVEHSMLLSEKGVKERWV